MTACVFLGPTLAVVDAVEILDATFLPPVKLGDVYRAVSRLRPSAIGIIDGYFQWVPPVWHKEILWAMGQGVPVFGAASMGALRAVELGPFGMNGVGRIVEAYRKGRLDALDEDPFEDDDEVAIVHGPPESGYRGVSEAMVNIRCTLIRATQEGVIAESTRRAIVADAKAVFFPARSYPLLLSRGRESGLPERELAALERWLPAGRVNQKRLDALAMLEAMRDFVPADSPQSLADPVLERTTYWESAEAVFRATAEPSASTFLAALRLNAAECERIGEDELRDWYFAHIAGTPVPADLGGWMREAGYADPDEFHRRVFAAYLQQTSSPGGQP